jgi:hypothetical protein
MERVEIYYGHLVYFTTIWYILWSFGIFYGHLVYFMVIWYILWSFGIFYGHLVYCMVIWYILWSFGHIFPVLVCCITKNLASLVHMCKLQPMRMAGFGGCVSCELASERNVLIMFKKAFLIKPVLFPCTLCGCN